MLLLKTAGSFWWVVAKGFGLFFLVFIGFALGNLLAGYLSSKIVVRGNPASIKNQVTVYLLSNGVHSDLVVPVKNGVMDWGQFVSLQDIKNPEPDLTYLGFGWGDRGFYLETPSWSELSFKVAFKAMFGLSKSAMHLTWHRTLQPNDRCKEIHIDEVDYEKLVGYLKRRFELQNNKPVLIKNHSYGGSDAFYEALGSYSCFYTCNTWTNNALKAAEQPACLWTLFDGEMIKITNSSK